MEVDADNSDACYMIVVVGDDFQVDSINDFEPGCKGEITCASSQSYTTAFPLTTVENLVPMIKTEMKEERSECEQINDFEPGHKGKITCTSTQSNTTDFPLTIVENLVPMIKTEMMEHDEFEQPNVKQQIPDRSCISDLSLSRPNNNATCYKNKPNTILEDQDYISSPMEVSSLVPLLTRIEDDEQLCRWIANSKSTNSNINETFGFNKYRFKQNRNISHPGKTSWNKEPEINNAESGLTRQKAKVENQRGKRKSSTRISNKRVALDSNKTITSETITKLVGMDKFTCTICDYSSTSKCSFDVHLLLHDNSFTCSMRSYVTKSPLCLNRIGKANKYINKPSSTQLTNSMDHNNEMPFKCLECPWSGELLTHLNSHMLKHFRDKGSCSPSETKVNSKSHQSGHVVPNPKVAQSVSSGIKATGKSQPNHMLPNLKRKESLSIVRDVDKENLRIDTLTGSKKSKVYMFECVLCSFKTCFEMQIKSHVEIHKNKSAVNLKPQQSSYLCELCPYACTSEEQLYIHTRSHSQVDKQLICEQCGCQLDQQAEHICALEPEPQAPMDINLNVSSEDKTDKSVNERTKQISVTNRNDNQGMDQIFDFDFSLDQKRTKTPNDIRNLHLLVDTIENETLRKKSRPSCRKMSSEDEFENHSKLNPSIPYKCSKCPFSFKKLSLLENHSLLQHKSRSKFGCLHCKYACDRQSDLDKHKGAVHSDIYRFSCDQCSYKCFYNVELKNHCETHAKPFGCSVCTKRFTCKKLLQQHTHEIKKKNLNSSPADSAAPTCQDENMDKTNQEVRSTEQITFIDNSTGTTQFILRDPGSIIVMVGTENNVEHGLKATTNVSSKKCPKTNTLLAAQSKSADPTNQVDELAITKGTFDSVKNSTPAADKDRSRPVCHICDLKFVNESVLRNHMLRHSNYHPFKCPICHKGFKRAEGVRTHMVLHTGDWVSCKLCDFQTQVIKTLAQHMKSHSKEKLYMCNMCSHKSKYKNQLKKHIRDEHGQQIKFNCSFCENKIFTTMAGYKNHLKFTHRKRIFPHWASEPISRHDVVPQSIDDDDLSRHTARNGQAFNKGDESEESSQYPSAFLTLLAKLSDPTLPPSERVNLGDLYEDIILSDSETTFICEKCGKSFKSSYILKNHMATHIEDRPFECTICTYTGKRKEDLKQHKMTHLNGIKADKNRCPYCDYTAVKRCYMEVHIRTHTGERPFACDKCSFRTIALSSLKVHKRIHTGERPFACPHCPKRFRQGNALRTHRCADPSEAPVAPDPPTPDELYYCVDCEYIAANKLSLVRHKVRVHHGGKPKSFSCRMCLLPFSAKYKLMRHQCKGSANDKDVTDEQIENGESSSMEKDFEDVSKNVNDDLKGLNEKRFMGEQNNDESESVKNLESDVAGSNLEHENNGVNHELDINTTSLSDSYTNLKFELHSVKNPLNHELLVDSQLISQGGLLKPGDFNIDDVGPEIVICEVVDEFYFDGQTLAVIAEAPSSTSSGNGGLPPELPIVGNVDNQAADEILDETSTEDRPTPQYPETFVETTHSFVPPVDLNECCICDTCGKVLKNKDALLEHFETHSKKPYKCEICSYTAQRSRILRKHLLKVHDIMIEEKTSTRKRKKGVNKKITSTVSESLKCCICSFGSDSRQSLEVHLQGHKGEKLSSCETCSRSFFTCYQMVHHICSAEKSKSQYSESELSEQNAATDLISQAMESSGVELGTVKQDNPVSIKKDKTILYKCNACDGTFSDIILLQPHILAHTDDGVKNVTVSVIVND